MTLASNAWTRARIASHRAAQPDTRPQCAQQAADRAAAVAKSTSSVLYLEDMSGLFIMEGVAVVLALLIRARRRIAEEIVSRRRARRELAKSTSRFAAAEVDLDSPMGGEPRPPWDRGGASGLIAAIHSGRIGTHASVRIHSHPPGAPAASDAGVLGHASQTALSVGGMEGRIATLVLEQTAALASDLEALRARLENAQLAEETRHKALLESVAAAAKKR